MCYHSCRWHQIPFTCTECPIRQVQMSCWLNTDFGDWKFWDRRNKKWPMINNQKKQDRGILMELCRKSWCNPEILKYILIAKAYSAEKCLCSNTDPFPKYTPDIPFTQSISAKRGTDQYGYPVDHWFPKYLLHHLSKDANDQKPKIFEKIPEDWLENFYDLYNSIVGQKPEDKLELYLHELLQKAHLEKHHLRKGDKFDPQGNEGSEDYDIDWEGRFEELPEEEGGEKDELYNNEYKEKDDKQEARKKRKTLFKDLGKKSIHNPVDIFYFDPLSEAQRQAYKLFLPNNLGPTKYTPPPEDQPRRPLVQYVHSNVSRIGNLPGRPSRSTNTFFEIEPTNEPNRKPFQYVRTNVSRILKYAKRPTPRENPRSVNNFFQIGLQSLYPRQWATLSPMASRVQQMQRKQSQHARLQVPTKKQTFRSSLKSKSPHSLPAKKSHFHSYGYS